MLNSGSEHQLRREYYFQVLNAAAALLVSGHVCNLAEGIALARETHQLGKALDTLDCWISVSHVSLASLILFLLRMK